MNNLDVFGLDMPCVDLNINVDEMPQPDHGVVVKELSWQGGGKVSSGIVAAARLGASCAIGGALGDDLYGRFCYEDFIRHGIDVGNLLVRKGASTHLSVVLSDKKPGKRSILFRPGDAPGLTQEEVDWEKVRRAEYLFLADASPLGLLAAGYARRCGTRVFIDADYTSEGLDELTELTDIFIGSEFVFDALYPGHKEKGLENLKEECKKLRERGPSVVVFTFGEKGCIGSDGNGYFVLPSFAVEAVDTVGAGDVFHGAFLAQLLKGKGIEECARAASAASAIKCTRIGGRAGIPSQAVLEKFLAEGVTDYGEIDERVRFYRRGLEYV